MPPEISTEPSERKLIRRRVSRRALLAGSVIGAQVAGAYAVLGDPLALFGSSGASDGPVGEAVRGDTKAIFKESVRISHLLRRTGFGVSPAEYDRYQGMGLQATLDELLNYDRIDDSEAVAAMQKAGEGIGLVPTVNSWLTRMAMTKRPLQEKMTLFWHGLLTSQLSVVVDREAMEAQVDIYRQQALGSFPTILKAVWRDPAMMEYLNIDGSERNAPNENYARELMELFALGIGNFSEKDVREAARAFTGWHVPRQRGGREGKYLLKTPVFRPQGFDRGMKTVLGKTGNFSPDDIVDIVVAQPASAQYIVRRLFEFLVYPNPTDAELEPFVEAYTKGDRSIRAAVEAILRSDVFYSPKAYRAFVKSPVEYTIGAIKALNGQGQLEELTAGNPRLGGVTGQMGQTLYEPPDVAGWPGNTSWLNASTMFARINFLNTVTGGAPNRRNPNATPAMGPRGLGTAAQALDHFVPLVLDDNISDEMRQLLVAYAGGADSTLTPEKLRGLIYLVLASPQFHVC